MPIVHLVRHGQAAFGTGDYDRLTELGHQQARWLGEYFAERGVRFTRIMTGSLRRQKETAAAMCQAWQDPAATSHDECLNEYRAREILRAHGATVGHENPVEYFRQLRAALHAWSAATITAGLSETWVDFGARIDRVLRSCVVDVARHADVLLVTSGGVIARAVADVLAATAQVAVELNLQVRNTSVTEFLVTEKGTRLISFNAVPHLERPDRRQALTYT